MKSILGFAGDTTARSPGEEPVTPVYGEHVRSLVTIRFPEDGRSFMYYNDRFDLEEGDRVFVSGKMAGSPGVVVNVTTKFRIRLSDYERVISKACSTIRGTYESVIGKMVSRDNEALTPEDFRSWVLPPRNAESGDEDAEAFAGDGFELILSELEEDEDVAEAVLERAADYCMKGKVGYIGVRGGAGTAYIHGTSWYEATFRLDGDKMTEMYCSCPYPGLCKHLLASAMTVRALAKVGDLDTDRDFTAVDESHFWPMTAAVTKRITL